MTIPYPGLMPTGWICPKCGAVYAPTMPACLNCVASTSKPAQSGTGTPLPPTYPTVSYTGQEDK